MSRVCWSCGNPNQKAGKRCTECYAEKTDPDAAPKVANVRHSSESVEHFTPGDIVEAARATMGSIDLDPATCELANRHIRASRIFTEAENGYLRSWFGNVFLNPPGGQSDDLEQRVHPKCTMTGKCGLPKGSTLYGPGGVEIETPGHLHKNVESSQKKWWFKTMREVQKRNVTSVIFIAFSIELFQTTQSKTPKGLHIPLDFPFCMPSARIDYWKEQEDGSIAGGGAPPHASAIVCISYDAGVREAFGQQFGAFGRVVRP